MLRFAPAKIAAQLYVRLGRIAPKVESRIVAAIALFLFSGFLLSCGNGKASTAQIPPANIAGSWEFLAVPAGSTNGAATGIEVALSEGTVVDNGLVVPNGAITADSAQMNFVSLAPAANLNTNITGFGGNCGASPTTNNNLNGTVTALGSPVTFTFTANNSVFTVDGIVAADGKSMLNGTYTATPPSGTSNACTDPGGTITGVVVSVPTGMYTGQMCSPAETSCSSPDDNVTATVTSKSGQVTLNLQLTGTDNTSLSLSGLQTGYAFAAQGSYQGGSAIYYGYFEQVYDPTLMINVQSLYLVNAADSCFTNPSTKCTTSTVISVPQIP